jgi:filamentous hemagglutinin family protein
MKELHAYGLPVLACLLSAIPSICFSQAPITSSGLNTQVSGPITVNGQTQFNITGGTRPGGGTNLFHSFGNFNVPNANVANFLNDTALPTSNILGRVTAGNISNIYGTVQTTGFSGANLYLMNPAGFLFGPNATLNVGGLVAFTSADYLRLADGVRFRATRNASADALLSTAPVAAFGFLGSNPGAITIQGSQLSVAAGTGISLIGGNITVQGGTLEAPSGTIALVSVGRASNQRIGGQRIGGEVVLSASGQQQGFNLTGFRNLRTINVSQSSSVDASASEGSTMDAGSVVIRGGKFVMSESSIAAGSTDQSSAGTIEVTADHVTLSNHSTLDVSAGTQFTSSVGRTTSAGQITFNVGIFSATDSTVSATAQESGAPGSGGGVGGTVTIQGLHGSGTFANSISANNTEVATTGCCRTVNAGPIAMQADSIALNQSTLNTSAGDDLGGPITLVSRGGLDIQNSSLFTTSNFSFGGTVGLEAGTSINLLGTNIITRGLRRSGSITIAAPIISISASTLNVNGSDQGGTITLTGKRAVSLTDGTFLSADGLFGGIVRINGGTRFRGQQSTVSASGLIGGGTITLDANKTTLTNSRILSTADDGQGGTITITSPRFRQDASTVIDASSQFGTNGTVTINGVVQP